MKQYLKNLKQFREERNLLTPNLAVTQKMAHEELDEVLDAKTWSHRIEEACDVCIVIHNYLAQKGEEYIEDTTTDEALKSVDEAVLFCKTCLDGLSEHWVIDAMRDFITLNGYDFDLAMTETTRKILSREGAMNHETGKWQKDANQDKSTLYVPNYSKCKL